ncbi:MAG: hypothetical protein CVT64_11875 [Actinobacteria bacterium HGW-Actinobacteria-4]|nr:MAG: hypothetical protein CVT64_11875 [Actinobacteria bacterium HGW-Actinobacteria-4]
MVLAYVLPQRIKERTDYALVRTEDRYSAEMRVVKSTAQRVERPTTRTASNSGEVPLLVTGTARASIVALGDQTMSRPVGPLDRAATAAQRQHLSLSVDRSATRSARAAQARRRATVAVATALLATVAWVLVAAAAASAIIAAVATALFAGTVVAGARAAAAQREADARVRLVAREVEAAATATHALRRVAAERAAGREAVPSRAETQAIRVVTADDLAPLGAPAPLPAPALPGRDAEPWSPNEMPAPAYTLKATVKQQRARPLSDEDFAASAMAAERAADARRDSAAQAQNPTTGALDAILARRRRASA